MQCMYKRYFRLKYPKTLLLILLIAAAYFIFDNPNAEKFIQGLGDLRYFGVFIAGLLFSFGFTSPFAAGFFIISNPENVILAGIVGGLGALVADMLIFRFVRFSFKDEFDRLKDTRTIVMTRKLIRRSIGRRFGVYLMYAFAGLLIASPLPDEAGIIMLAGLTEIKVGKVAFISFTLNTLGIIALLLF